MSNALLPLIFLTDFKEATAPNNFSRSLVADEDGGSPRATLTLVYGRIDSRVCGNLFDSTGRECLVQLEPGVGVKTGGSPVGGPELYVYG